MTVRLLKRVQKPLFVGDIWELAGAIQILAQPADHEVSLSVFNAESSLKQQEIFDLMLATATQMGVLVRCDPSIDCTLLVIRKEQLDKFLHAVSDRVVDGSQNV